MDDKNKWEFLLKLDEGLYERIRLEVFIQDCSMNKIIADALEKEYRGSKTKE